MFFFGYTLSMGSAAVLCAFLQGVMMVGVLIGIFATLSYGLDSFRSQSSEIFVMNMLFKVSRIVFHGATSEVLILIHFRRISCFTVYPISQILG